jgi:hypothetical protein
MISASLDKRIQTSRIHIGNKCFIWKCTQGIEINHVWIQHVISCSFLPVII